MHICGRDLNETGLSRRINICKVDFVTFIFHHGYWIDLCQQNFGDVRLNKKYFYKGLHSRLEMLIEQCMFNLAICYYVE